MQIECPGCNARYRIEPGNTTKNLVNIKCPKCGVSFKVALKPQEQGAQSQAPVDRTRVLVVDDAKFFRELILDILKPLPLEVLTASDGMEALRVIGEKKPALVLLDLNIPKMNGYDLIKAVRGDASISDNTYLLVMSGAIRKEDDIRKIERAGADDFMSKSFTPEELLQRIRKVLGLEEGQ